MSDKTRHRTIFSSNESLITYNKQEVYPSKLRNEVYAMYSSVLDGIVTEPEMMTVPLDDHMVHRGRTFLSLLSKS